jgi:hypothetical protein
MSPDRGELDLTLQLPSESSHLSKDRTDSGYGDSMMEEGEEKGKATKENPNQNSSREEQFQDAHQTLPQAQDDADQNNRSLYKASSVKSVSSAPSSKSSRRDSAVSSSTQSRRKIKVTRSASHQGPRSASSSTAARPQTRRIPSSPHVQTRKQNIEEALALHERSIRIFGPSSRPTTSSGAPMTPTERPFLYRSTTTADVPLRRGDAPSGPVRSHTSPEDIPRNDIVEEELQYDNFVPATTMHWTSAETRRKEYSKIDRSNKGVRGLMKKWFPKLTTRASDSKFYDEKEGSTAGSVRRFRIDLPDEEEKGSRGGR